MNGEDVAFGVVIGLLITALAFSFYQGSGSGTLPGEVNESDAEVFFSSYSESDTRMGVYLPGENESVLCSFSQRDEVQIGRGSYKYVNASCSGLEGSLDRRLDDPDFENFVTQRRLRRDANVSE
jgi:hypothetical protein